MKDHATWRTRFWWVIPSTSGVKIGTEMIASTNQKNNWTELSAAPLLWYFSSYISVLDLTQLDCLFGVFTLFLRVRGFNAVMSIGVSIRVAPTISNHLVWIAKMKGHPIETLKMKRTLPFLTIFRVLKCGLIASSRDFFQEQDSDDTLPYPHEEFRPETHSSWPQRYSLYPYTANHFSPVVMGL